MTSTLFSSVRFRREVTERDDDDEFSDVVSPSFTIIRGLEAPPFPSHIEKGNAKNETKRPSGEAFYWHDPTIQRKSLCILILSSIGLELAIFHLLNLEDDAKRLSLIFISEESEKPSNNSSTKTYPPSPEPDISSSKPNSPTIKAYPPSSKSNDSFSKPNSTSIKAYPPSGKSDDSFSKPNRTSIKAYPPSGKFSKSSRKTKTSVNAYPPSKSDVSYDTSNVSSNMSDVPSKKRNASSRKSDISNSKFDFPFEYEMYPGEDEDDDAIFVQSSPEDDDETVKGGRSRSRSWNREEVDRNQNQDDLNRKTTADPENSNRKIHYHKCTNKHDDDDHRETVKGGRSRSRSWGREEVDRNQNQDDINRKTTVNSENSDGHYHHCTSKHDDDHHRGLPPVLRQRIVEKDTPWISVGAVIGNF